MIMKTKEILLQLALHEVAFEYYSLCRKRGATDAEAKAEMMTAEAQAQMKERVLQLIN